VNQKTKEREKKGTFGKKRKFSNVSKTKKGDNRPRSTSSERKNVAERTYGLKAMKEGKQTNRRGRKRESNPFSLKKMGGVGMGGKPFRLCSCLSVGDSGGGLAGDRKDGISNI